MAVVRRRNDGEGDHQQVEMAGGVCCHCRSSRIGGELDAWGVLRSLSHALLILLMFSASRSPPVLLSRPRSSRIRSRWSSAPTSHAKTVGSPCDVTCS